MPKMDFGPKKFGGIFFLFGGRLNREFFVGKEEKGGGGGALVNAVMDFRAP